MTYDDLKAAVLSRLDVQSKFKEWGVRLAGQTATPEGWIKCHRYGDDNDRDPSASVNVKTGLYHSFGSGNADAENLSLWDLGARSGRYQDWRECLLSLAKEVGVDTSEFEKRQTFPPAWFEDSNNPNPLPAMIKRFCDAKDGVTPASLKAVGAITCRRHGRPLIAFPGFRPNAPSKPIAWQVHDVDGGSVPDKDGKPRRFLNVYGSRDGIIGIGALDSDTVWKMEGVSDCLAARALGLPAFTVTNGAKSTKLLSSIAESFRGKTVVLVPDCDESGWGGAVKTAAALAEAAEDILIVELPYERTPSRGKDFRDWVRDNPDADPKQLLQVAKQWQELSGHTVFFPSPLMARMAIKDMWTTSEGEQTIVFWQDAYWVWHQRKHRYVEMRDKRIQGIVNHYIARNPAAAEWWSDLTGTVTNNVLLSVRGEASAPDDEWQMPYWIDSQSRHRRFMTMKNGIVDLDEIIEKGDTVVLPHTPNWFSNVALEYNYDSKAECPTWMRFLDEQVPGEAERLICQEFFGYCLIPTLSAKKFLILRGDTNTGKSTFCDVLTDMLGEVNTSSIAVERFGNQFGLSDSLGKLANIVSEANEMSIEQVGAIKQYTSGDQMSFDRKYKTMVTARPTAKLVVSTNTLPHFTDRSDALWDRMLLIPFDEQVPKNKRDRELRKKIQDELAGVFNWAVGGARRFLSEGFTESKLVQSVVAEEKWSANPTGRWILDHYEVGTSEDGVARGKMYAKYREQMYRDGHRPMSHSQFSKEVRRLFPEVSEARPGVGTGRGRARLWTGIKEIE